jgi:hypothetical protein
MSELSERMGEPEVDASGTVLSSQRLTETISSAGSESMDDDGDTEGIKQSARILCLFDFLLDVHGWESDSSDEFLNMGFFILFL